MTKSMTEAADPASDTQRAHVERLAAALAVESCSPSLAASIRAGFGSQNSSVPATWPIGKMCREAAQMVSRAWTGVPSVL